MEKFTIDEFRKLYPDEDACLEKLWQLRFGDLQRCPKCDCPAIYKRVKGRRSYQCSLCSNQLYPTAYTVFDKTTTPLVYWFYAIFLQTTTRNGVAAKELERQLNVCYKTALRMAHQIKKLMAPANVVLDGVVECDETWIGGRISNKHSWERKAIGENSKLSNKTPVFAIIQRETGFVIGKVITESIKSVVPIIYKTVKKGSVVNTDAANHYAGLENKYDHQVVHHDYGQFVAGKSHTNTIEGYFSLLKRTIKGTHIHVSDKHLPKYVDEVSFRYLHRNNQKNMFESVLQKVI